MKTSSSTCFKLIAIIPLSTSDSFCLNNLKGYSSTDMVEDISEDRDFLLSSFLISISTCIKRQLLYLILVNNETINVILMSLHQYLHIFLCIQCLHLFADVDEVVLDILEHGHFTDDKFTETVSL